MHISLRQLRAFTTIARLGSFVEAARALHVTPAALSSVIREMEEALGFRVFDRTTRRVVLNEAGQQYFHYADQVLVALRKAEMCAQDLRDTTTGVVRIATTQFLTWVLLPKAFGAFRAQWPQVRIEPIDIPTDQIMASVENGLADLAINFRQGSSDSLEGTPLFRTQVQMVCPHDHRFAQRSSVQWKELHDERIIFVGRGSELRLRAELSDAVPLVAAHEVGNTSTALALAASGAGVVLCAGYVRPLTQMHGLRMVPLEEPTVVHSFMLYHKRLRPLAPAVEAHRAFLLQYFAAAGSQCVEETLEL